MTIRSAVKGSILIGVQLKGGLKKPGMNVMFQKCCQRNLRGDHRSYKWSATVAEELLVKEPLTKEMIEAGEQLRQRLKSTDLKLVGLFWLYSLESNDWQLTLVSLQID